MLCNVRRLGTTVGGIAVALALSRPCHLSVKQVPHHPRSGTYVYFQRRAGAISLIGRDEQDFCSIFWDSI